METVIIEIPLQVVADSKIVDSGKVSYPRETKNGEFSFWMTSDLYKKMAPRAKVMAWAVTSTGSFIADSVMMELDMKLPNEVGNVV